MSVKCQYCGQIYKSLNVYNCSSCGAVLPEREKTPEHNIRQSRGGNYEVLLVAGVFIAIVALAIIAIHVFAPRQETRTISRGPLDRHIGEIVQERVPTTPVLPVVPEVVPTPEVEEIVVLPVVAPPHERITNSVLRQMVELYFEKDIHEITWDEIHGIRTMVFQQDSILLSNDAVSINNLSRDSRVIEIVPDSTRIRDNIYQIRHFAGVEVFGRNGPMSTTILSAMPNLRELSISVSRDYPDLTRFFVLPNLQRLELRGGSLTSLSGLADLHNLYALSLTSTEIRDLSILSLQTNITELTLNNNILLPSYETLRAMTWLRSLHIERSDLKSLTFIADLTELEELTLIRTDTRTLDFILSLAQLRYLHLSMNRDVPAMPSLQGLNYLEELSVEVNNFDNATTSFLTGSTSLRRLTLYNPDDLVGIRGLQNLEELDIQLGFRLNDVRDLGALSNLRRLRIFSRGPAPRSFPTENMQVIGNLTNLVELDISNTGMYFNWNFIFDMENLERLDISNTTIFGDISRISRMQNLRVLLMDDMRLAQSYQFSGAWTTIGLLGPLPVEIATPYLASLTNLEVLSMSGNELSDINFVAGMQNLRILLLVRNFIADVSPLAELESLRFVDMRRNIVTNWDSVDHMVNTTFLGR